MLYRGSTTHVTVFAPAKLNLFLKVLEKRADGYHELETLMVSVGLYDTLIFTDAPCDTTGDAPGDTSQETWGGNLHLTCCDGGSQGGHRRELPSAGADNLVLRAARLLREYSATTRGANRTR